MNTTIENDTGVDRTFEIPITWMCRGTVKIRARTFEEAITYANSELTEGDVSGDVDEDSWQAEASNAKVIENADPDYDISPQARLEELREEMKNLEETSHDLLIEVALATRDGLAVNRSTKEKLARYLELNDAIDELEQQV